MNILGNLSENSILSAHQYQYDGTHPNPNECGSNSMVMVLAIAAAISGSMLELKPRALTRFLDRIPFRHLRFPAWFPGPGGATHPKAAEKGMQAIIDGLKAQGRSFPWSAERRSRQSLTDLGSALKAARPTLVYGVGVSTGVPHVVVPVAHENQEWLILDPGYPKARQPMRWTDQQFEEWWVNYGWLYPAGTMVSLIPARQSG
ncbi:MAG: hypothetical protein O3B43_00290 [Chloroflexi bacterium]|nr:hypothetical protein [Chloroflexota bacterium]